MHTFESEWAFIRIDESEKRCNRLFTSKIGNSVNPLGLLLLES